MTTMSLETGNLSNALERQVQTLVLAVEWLTQWNQELEQQMNLVNERHAQTNNLHNEQHNDEHNNNNLSRGDQHEAEDQEESNVANRHSRRD